ncbi:hypothetical protein I5677_12315 [Mobilitalea sibirica]|uniref:Uncharacterized protein n=1 Tax=Mobilitalea sibirica TaxID=1462919 RepID=A0A8J7L327_9FIRM|nr:hypothetical protein [Mobilitalea sibirica]MBH1941678.1 hypothetical protein [Mobilitalea sibirica]
MIKTKQQIQQLAAFFILVIGIAAIVLLTGAMVNQFIKPGTYLSGMAVAGIALYFDAGWIDKHFIDGEWI